MLKFNLKRMLRLRGVERPVRFMIRAGFEYPTAHKLLEGTPVSLRIDHIKKLCVALNCTPNELFEWHSDATTVLPENHSLKALIRDTSDTKSLQEMFKDIPADKLALIETILNELKK